MFRMVRRIGVEVLSQEQIEQSEKKKNMNLQKYINISWFDISEKKISYSEYSICPRDQTPTPILTSMMLNFYLNF